MITLSLSVPLGQRSLLTRFTDISPAPGIVGSQYILVGQMTEMTRFQSIAANLGI